MIKRMTKKMAFSLTGKRTLITGGTAGIGYAVAKRFVDNGAHVIISGRREEGVDIAETIGARFLQADMMVDGDIVRLVDQAAELLGGLDVVVNNAGIAESDGGIEKSTEEAYESQMSVNLDAAFRILQLTPKHMSSGGSIINTASISGTWGEPNLAVYGATKAALISLTKSAALDLARRNIRVNAVNPGFIYSEIWNLGPPDDLSKTFVPLGRVGEADEAAAPYHFLASDDASYVTGSCIGVDGGLSAGHSVQSMKFMRDNA
jgi:NAD(P)-dependent dehydrogenase (short-subunit alcohol dehydrogenase family)